MPDTKLQQIVQKMIDAGESEDNIASVIREYKPEPSLLQKANTPLVDIRAANPTAHAATEEFAKEHPIIGGAANFAVDTLSGMTSPASLALGAATMGSGAAAKLGFPAVARALSLPSKIASGAQALHGVQKIASSETLPEAAGGAIETALGVSGVPEVSNPAIRATGRGLERVAANKAFRGVVRGGAAGLAGASAYSMHPEGVIGGIGATLLPEGLGFIGRKLQAVGGVAPEAAGLPSGARELDFGNIKSPNIGVEPRTSVPNERVPNVGMPAEASGRVQKIVAKETAAAEKAAQNEANRQAIEEARKGLEAKPPTFGESVSASTPEGRMSMSTRFGKPGQSSAVSAPSGGGSMEQELMRRGLDPSRVVSSKSTPGAAPTGFTGVETPDQVFSRATSAGGRYSNANEPQPLPGVAGRQTYSAAEDLSTPSAMAATERLAAGARPVVKAMEDAGQFAGERTTGTMRPAMKVDPYSQELMNRTPVSEIPASRSSRAMSATPGLSREDALALGINPDMKITGLRPDLIKQLLAERAQRSGAYRSNAGLDAMAQALMEREQ